MNWQLTAYVRGVLTLLTLGRDRRDIYGRARDAIKDLGEPLESIEPICIWRWGRLPGEKEGWIYFEDLDLRKAKVYRHRL